MVSIELSEGAGRVWAAARPPVRLVWRARPIPCRLVARWPSHNHGEQSRRPATYRSARRLRLRAHWRLTPGSAATRRQLGASARGPSGLDGAVLPWSPPGRTDSRREMNQESHRPVELAHPRCWRCFHDLRVPASPTRTVEHARGYRRRSTTATANAIIYTNAAETLDDVDPNIACERSRRRPSLAQRYRKRIPVPQADQVQNSRPQGPTTPTTAGSPRLPRPPLGREANAGRDVADPPRSAVELQSRVRSPH